MSDTLKKTGGFIDWFTPKRAITISILLIIVIIVIVFVWKRVKNAVGKVGESADRAILEAKGVTLTYPKAQYNTFADTIHNAYGWFYDSVDDIYGVIGMLKNDLDFLELKKAYGLRPSTYMGTMGTMEQNMGWRLDSKEISKINSILRNNGINYQV